MWCLECLLNSTWQLQFLALFDQVVVALWVLSPGISAEVALLYLCPQQNVFPWQKSQIDFFFSFLLIFLESICRRHESWPGETSLALSGFWNHPSTELAWCEVEVSWLLGFLGQEGSVLWLLPDFPFGTHGCFTCQCWDLETEWGRRRSLGWAVCMQEKPYPCC